MIQNNVVMVGLTISMHFQQLEDLKFPNFPVGTCPRTRSNTKFLLLVVEVCTPPWKILAMGMVPLVISLYFANHNNQYLWQINKLMKDYVIATNLNLLAPMWRILPLWSAWKYAWSGSTDNVSIDSTPSCAKILPLTAVTWNTLSCALGLVM